MLTRRQVKVDDRSARPLRRTVVLDSLRNEQQSWYLHPNAGRATPQQAPAQHLEVELRQLGRVSAVQGHAYEPKIAGRRCHRHRAMIPPGSLSDSAGAFIGG